MTRTSCIEHPASTPFLVIREEYVRICKNNVKADAHCAAAILAIFEHWHNVKLDQAEEARTRNEIDGQHGKEPTHNEELWVYKSQSDLKDELLGLFGERAIAKSLDLLINMGVIDVRNNPHRGWDRTLQYLFLPEKVMGHIRKLATCKPQKCGMEAADLQDASRKNAEAIPEITTTITPEITDLSTSPVGLSGPSQPFGNSEQLDNHSEKSKRLAEPAIPSSKESAGNGSSLPKIAEVGKSSPLPVPAGFPAPPPGYAWMTSSASDVTVKHLVRADGEPERNRPLCGAALPHRAYVPQIHGSRPACAACLAKVAEPKTPVRPEPKPWTALSTAMHEATPDDIRPSRCFYAKHDDAAKAMFEAGRTAEQVAEFTRWKYANDPWMRTGSDGIPVVITMSMIEKQINGWLNRQKGNGNVQANGNAAGKVAVGGSGVSGTGGSNSRENPPSGGNSEAARVSDADRAALIASRNRQRQRTLSDLLGHEASDDGPASGTSGLRQGVSVPNVSAAAVGTRRKTG